MKKLFGIFLVLSILLFVFIQWGMALFGGNQNVQAAGELNAEKIILLDMPGARLTPALVQSSVHPVVPASAPAPQIPPAVAAIPATQPTTVAVVVPSPVPSVTPAAPAPAKPLLPAAGKVVHSCMEWGEFSGTDLANAEKMLATMKLGERVSQRTVEYDRGYWVYIPPLKNKAAAQKKVEELKEAGFTEYFILGKEAKKLNNAISLGVFKAEDTARELYKLARKKGFKTVKTGERKRKLTFVVFSIRDLDTDAVAQLGKMQKDLPNSELKKIACKNP